jgi:CRP-like cAMP-binding protein
MFHPARDFDQLVTRFFRRLEQHDILADDERAALRGIIGSPEEIHPGTDIVHEGERPNRSTLLLEGIAYRYRVMRDGRRQILALNLPGDVIDLHSFPLKVMDHSIGARSVCVVARFPHDELLRVTEAYPHLTRLLWLLTLIDGAIMREWAVGLGRRSASERMAHLICEFHLRLDAVGLDGNRSFALPISQGDLGDMLGLSVVHTNRTLQELRVAKLVSWEHGVITILDPDGLSRLADFDPTYLHLRKEPR